MPRINYVSTSGSTPAQAADQGYVEIGSDNLNPPGSFPFRVDQSGNVTAVKATVPSVLDNRPAPADHGLLTWTYDIFTSSQAATAVTNGTLYLAGMYLRAATQISKIWYAIGTAAVSPVAGQNFAILFGGDGTVLGSVGIDTNTTSAAPHGESITPVSAGPGLVWAGFIANAATPPAFLRGISSAGAYNVGQGVATSRYVINGTSRTAVPASITPASNSITGAQAIWAALS